ncbi:MAG: class I adenylate-forming enzyme family protein [Woeseiaceae bacterium]|nr:class I adenylate-forming enzyme family protein [Woeseiaceae bacterium]
MNLAAVVRANAKRLGSKPAILFHDDTISYAQLWASIESLAAALAEAGIDAGDRVGLALKDHPLHVIAHYAIARLGAIIVPMDHRWTDSEKQSAAAAFGTAVTLTDRATIPDVHTLNLDASLLEADSANLPEIDETDRDLLISLSSGTTGRPKGALLTHQNFYERFKAQWQAIGYGENDCFGLLTPLFFGAGRSFAMSMLAAGGCLRLAPPPLKPPQIVEVLQDPGITATFLPPTLLRRLLKLHDPGSPPLFPQLRYLLVSGEPLFAEEALQCLQQISPNIYSYYASSEGGGISLLTAADFDRHGDTVGMPMPNTDVQIVDDADRSLPPGEVGRLRYRGPGVATRYLDSDGNEHEAASGGWFYPGDLAERLDAGYIALRGRDKDVIIRGGVNIYPAEIESTLLQHAQVADAAVTGVADAERGQIVVAFIGTDSGQPVEDLETYCKHKLAPYKIPQEFRFLRELPRRSSGKIDKKALLESRG